jgi:exopolysaccharide production protein ExoQ
VLLAKLLEEPDVRAPHDRRFLGSGLCEALFAAAVLLPLLFVVQLGSKGPALSFAMTVAWAAARGRQGLGGLGRQWPVLLIPAFALLSTIWSDYPGVTSKHALELCLTALGGLLLASSPAPAGALAGAWGSFALFMLVSLALGKTTDMNSFVANADEFVFAGLNGMKNLFGMTAAIAALTSLFMLSRAASRKSALVFAGVLVILLVELYLVFAARSAGATIGLALAAVAFSVTACFGPVRPGGRIIACCLLVLLAAAVGVLVYAYKDVLASGTLSLFHKDSTLTGRSYLWYRSADFIRERPMLGRGFEGFWVQGNTDAEGLWRYAKMDNRSAFNFHNTLIEFLVHFGIVGTALCLSVFLYACVRLFRRAILQPNVVSAFYIGFIVFEISRAPVESLTPQSVDFSTVLMFAALGYGFEKLSAFFLAQDAEIAFRRRLAQSQVWARAHPTPQMARESWLQHRVRRAGQQPLG